MTMYSTINRRDPHMATLPKELQAKLSTLISKYPEVENPIQELLNHFNHGQVLTHKKQKIHVVDPGSTLIKLPEMSFQSPMRKKLVLKFHDACLSIWQGDKQQSLTLYNSISRILFLPTPNKQKSNFTVVIIAEEHIIFSFDEKTEKFNIESDLNLQGSTSKEQIYSVLCLISKKHQIPVEQPEQTVFTSAKSSKTVQFHLDCYNKTKEGCLILIRQLYFFRTGIFLGFKKPCYFFDCNEIKELGISGVTGRTFNLVVKLDEIEHEFSMISAEEYDRIADYINKFQKGKLTGVPTKDVGTLELGEDIALDDTDSEDESYCSNDSDTGIAEEYDSGHESDQSSISINSKSDGDLSDDEQVNKMKPGSVMKSQWDVIEAQRKNRPAFKKSVAEEASDSEDNEGPSNQTMETGDDDDDFANGIQNISETEEDELEDM